MIHDGAQGIVTADPVARIATLVPNASSIPRAILIQETFRMASEERVSVIFGNAGAHTVKALRVCTAIQARIRRSDRCI